MARIEILLTTMNSKETFMRTYRYIHSAPFMSREYILDNFNYDWKTGTVTRCFDDYEGSIKSEDTGPKYRVFGAPNGNGEWITVYAHQIAWAWLGRPPLKPGETIDHRDGDGLNNRSGNLRAATHAQQQWNRSVLRSNRLGLKGVTFVSGAFVARIQVDGRRLHLGRFRCPTAARLAYLRAEKRYRGEWAREAA
jgi:hypothetical protein